MADVVITEPLEELVEQSLTTNPRAPLTEEEQHAAASYGGYGHLLVRTAVVRAEGWQNVRGPYIRGADEAIEVVQHLGELPRHRVAGARFVTLLLDGQNRLLGIHERDGSFVEDPDADLKQEVGAVLRLPLLVGSSAFICAHSGKVSPSATVVKFVRRLVDAARSYGLHYLDHIVVPPMEGEAGAPSSLRDLGLMG